jgi:hypothetical protein
MSIIFTVATNSHLARAAVLATSLKKYAEDTTVFTILVDTLDETIAYDKFPFITIPIGEIEPEIDQLAEKYTILELSCCLKPFGFQYFFEHYKEDQVLYFDSDIAIYSSLELFETLFATHDILLTPHIFSSIPVDGLTPNEGTFITYGLYNSGFVGVKRSEEGMKFVNWWKSNTYSNCFVDLKNATFVDQLCLNHTTMLFENVFVIKDAGCNMAQWNLHERYLTMEDGRYVVNRSSYLKFFHFASFKLNSDDLPKDVFNRYSLMRRPDLVGLYAEYNQNLARASADLPKKDSHYYERFIDKKMTSIEATEQKKWENKSLVKQLFYKLVPKRIIHSMANWFGHIDNEYPYSKYIR